MKFAETIAYLSPNPYSSPGADLPRPRGVVVHWVANPGSGALANRDYFESLKEGRPDPATGQARCASAHAIVGLRGEIVHCVPFDRVAYHCGAGQLAGPDGRFYTPLARQRWPECTADPVRDSPNRLLLGIEFCHPDASGQPTPETRAALVWLLAGLCRRYGLSPGNDLFRHQDIVGYKECPRWYCRQPREWEALLADVAQAPEAWP